jgi:hypothetical protein
MPPMPLPTETQDEESNPFAVFETAAQILGFIHHKYGEKDLRELIAMLQGEDMSREYLEDAADELKQAGLKKPAAIVAEAASQFPLEITLNPHPPDSPEWHTKIALETGCNTETRAQD